MMDVFKQSLAYAAGYCFRDAPHKKQLSQTDMQSPRRELLQDDGNNFEKCCLTLPLREAVQRNHR